MGKTEIKDEDEARFKVGNEDEDEASFRPLLSPFIALFILILL